MIFRVFFFSVRWGGAIEFWSTYWNPTGRTTQTTRSRKGPARDLGESMNDCFPARTSHVTMHKINLYQWLMQYVTVVLLIM